MNRGASLGDTRPNQSQKPNAGVQGRDHSTPQLQGIGNHTSIYHLPRR